MSQARTNRRRGVQSRNDKRYRGQKSGSVEARARHLKRMLEGEQMRLARKGMKKTK